MMLEAMVEIEEIWRMEDDPDTAIRYLSEILSMHPRFEAALHLKAQILVEEDYPTNDIRQVLKKIRQVGHLRIHEQVNLGLTEMWLMNFQEALSIFEEVLTKPEALKNTSMSAAEIQRAAKVCRAQLAVPVADTGPANKPSRSSAPPSRAPAKTSVSLPNNKGTGERRADISAKPGVSDDTRVATAPSTPSPSPRPSGAPASIQTEVSASVGPASPLGRSFESGQLSGLSRYFLGLRAMDLARADTFDNLLGMDGLTGVRHYTYQTDTVRKVLRSFRGRVLLADEVGLGKTIEAGMVLREYILRGMVKKALVLVPPSIVSQWCEELSAKFALEPIAAEGTEFRNDPESFWRNQRLIVASLALARNQHHQPILERLNFDIVIVDEAHHVKNARTAGWKLVNALKSRFLLLLSATPVENDLMDLYSLVTLLKPGQLGTRTAFRRDFVLRGDPTQAKNRERLRELIAEVMIRNTRALADIKLPPRHATTVLVEGAPSERELYTRLTALVRSAYTRGVSKLSLGILLQEAGSSPGAVRQTLIKMASRGEHGDDLRMEMKKIAKLCEYVPGTAKTDRLIDLLSAAKEKTLVFSRYTATLAELSQRLQAAGIRFSVFTGNESAAEKDAAVEAFSSDTDVMLCSEIGGEGRNLQFCSTMVNFDLPWNPMKIEQRIGRIHRIGQTRPVHVYNFCAMDTAEHHILEVLDRRLNLFELVIGEVDLVLGQLKTEAEFEERILDIYGTSADEEDVARTFEKLGEELLAARTRYEAIKALDEEIFTNDYEI